VDQLHQLPVVVVVVLTQIRLELTVDLVVVVVAPELKRQLEEQELLDKEVLVEGVR
jgi:hypothetical protein